MSGENICPYCDNHSTWPLLNMNNLRYFFMVAVLFQSAFIDRVFCCVRTISPAEIPCPSLSVADGAVFYSSDKASHFEGTAAAFTCNAGFQAQGTQTIVCQPDGQWSGTLGTCEPLVTQNSACPALNIANGVVSYSPNAASNLEGTVATYTCSAGFLAQGTQSIICQSNGQWTGTLGTCEIQCGLLTTNDPFANTITYVPSTRLQGSVAMLVCLSGFAVSGNDQRVCQADGTFSSAFGSCQPVCPDYPNDDPNANPIVYDQTPHFLTSGITRTCKAGFTVVQPNQANCIEIPAGSNTLNWDMVLGLCAATG